MSEERHEPDSPDQATDTTPSADPKATSPNSTTAAQTPDTAKSAAETEANSKDPAETNAGFEPVTIRSYLADQFGVREVATTDQPAAPVAPPTDAKAELAKWRERVPKLASALRDRTAQISELEEQVARLQAQASKAVDTDADELKTRDARIAELEMLLQGVTTSYQETEGSLRAQGLELDDMRADLAAAQQRWQALTESLDAQVASTQQAQADLQAASATQTELQAQLTSLAESNESLDQSARLVDEQAHSQQQELSQLRAELSDQEQDFAAKLAGQKQAGLLETAQIQAEHSERLRDIHAQTLLVFEAVEAQNDQERAVDAERLQTSLRREFELREVGLQQEVAALQQASAGLMQQIQQMKTQLVQAQRAQLHARSQHQADKQQALIDLTLVLEAEMDLLQQPVRQPEPEPEQQRIVFLGEISDSSEGRGDFVREWRSLDDSSIDAANETIRELERLLEIRNEELNAALAARVHFLPPASAQAPVVARATAEAVAQEPEDEASTLASLRLEIENANAENARLRQQLDRTSAALLASDDLTQLKGVGGKLAEQLRELGISQFAQMAALTMEELEQPDHPLYNMRGRIERNGWIEQAKALVNPLTLYGQR